ncbi:MAG: HAMP domain-containing protein [Alphaproteobacteria bacterium]|nr:HAMP domain-containing protein [Alphaproteobacteria bacterium]MBU1562971.1 HAMP domain-containing protein [Alphaproteobacteria bacterium]MBU2304166.1 HAMP domain-containing protein [Alphaproteobacteria bacterium]MBU2367463.1 HAMP domain-containing protein [Alphaproteobacteria bacterium]
MNFRNIPILQKLVLTVLLMGVVATAIAAIGWRELGSLRDVMDRVGAKEVAAREAMDLRMDVIAISRMTYQLVLNPAGVADFVTQADRRMTEMKGRFPIIEAAADETELGQLEAVKPVMDAYFGKINDMLTVAAAQPFDQAALDAALAEALAAQLVVTDTIKLYSTYSGELMASMRDAAETSAFNAMLTLAISAGAGIVVGLGVSLLVGRRTIVNPVRDLTHTMIELADGKLDVTISNSDAKDEIGAMARAVEVFRQNGKRVAALSAEEAARNLSIVERADMMALLQAELGSVMRAASAGDFAQRVPTDFTDDKLNGLAASVNGLVETVDRGLAETGTVLSAIANTDLTQRVTGQYQGAFGALKDNTNAVAEKLADIVAQLKGTSRSLKTATSEILAGANDLSERTTRQAATIEETSAAMEQLAGTVLENAKRAQDANGNATRVTATAEMSGEVMAQATGAMERITTSSSKISNIIGLIDDIAFQTNLLALNASVEAARAGDAGKGFAVVAVEVRRLAQSAASASADVKVLIEQSAKEVSDGSRLVADAAERINGMLEGVRSSSTLMEGISRDSQEQSTGITEVSIAVRQMDEMTQHNAALVEEMNAAIEQTENQATQLDAIVDIFKVSDAGPVRRSMARAA